MHKAQQSACCWSVCVKGPPCVVYMRQIVSGCGYITLAFALRGTNAEDKQLVAMYTTHVDSWVFPKLPWSLVMRTRRLACCRYWGTTHVDTDTPVQGAVAAQFHERCKATDQSQHLLQRRGNQTSGIWTLYSSVYVLCNKSINHSTSPCGHRLCGCDTRACKPCNTMESSLN